MKVELSVLSSSGYRAGSLSKGLHETWLHMVTPGPNEVWRLPSSRTARILATRAAYSTGG